MTKHYEFTGKVKSGNLKQIRALVDIPRYVVKAGDIGGWITESTILGENCWVSGEAKVENSTLEGEVHLTGEAMVSNSQVSGKSSVRGNSLILNSKVVNVKLSKQARIENSVVSKENSIDFLGDSLFLNDVSSIVDSDINIVSSPYATSSGIFINNGSKLTNAKISGANISLYSVKSMSNSTITGTNIEIRNVGEVEDTIISGNEISIKEVKSIIKSKLYGTIIFLKHAVVENSYFHDNQKLIGKDLDNPVQIKDSHLTIKGIRVIGSSILEGCSFIDNKHSTDSIPLAIRGKNHLQSVTIFGGKHDIQGQNFIARSTIECSFEIEGENHIENSVLKSFNSEIKGSCQIISTALTGVNNRVNGFVKIIGEINGMIELKGEVLVREFAEIRGTHQFEKATIQGETNIS